MGLFGAVTKALGFNLDLSWELQQTTPRLGIQAAEDGQGAWELGERDTDGQELWLCDARHR